MTVKTKNSNQEDEFYSELDQDKNKPGFCSCYSLAVFFILLFCFLSALLIHFLRGFEFKKADTASLTQQTVSFGTTDFTKKEPTIALPMTSDDLTSIVKAGLQGAGAKISEPQVIIGPSAITLSGQTKMILEVSSKMEILPTISDDRLYLKIIKFQSWRLGFPGFVRGSLESSLNKLMDENLKSFYDNYKATDVQLTDGKMTIYGKLK